MELNGSIRPITSEERKSRNPLRVFRTNTLVSPEESSKLTKKVVFLCGVKKFCGQGRHGKLLRLASSDLRKQGV
jgi:hypothetical protein